MEERESDERETTNERDERDEQKRSDRHQEKARDNQYTHFSVMRIRRSVQSIHAMIYAEVEYRTSAIVEGVGSSTAPFGS
jgi:hypothetical protein